MKEQVGGPENVGATKQDFKNFQRDLKAYISGADGQMFVQHFSSQNEKWGPFFFEYEVDPDGCLVRALWCDSACMANYAIYGDMVSFDTTFKTNKYVMLFDVHL